MASPSRRSGSIGDSMRHREIPETQVTEAESRRARDGVPVLMTLAERGVFRKDELRDAWARADELRTGSIKTRVYKAPLHLAALRNARIMKTLQ